MAKIIQGIKTSKLTGVNLATHKLLDTRLAIAVPGAQFTPQFKKKTWDGKIHYYNGLNGVFPSGLLDEVVSILSKEFEFQVYIQDTRTPPPKEEPISPKLNLDFELRPYQLAASQCIIEKVNCIMQAATNAGKTVILAEILRLLNLTTLVLIHRLELLTQTAEYLSSCLGIPVGIIGGGKSTIEKVTVAMPGSLTKRNKTKFGPKLAIRNEYTSLVNTSVMVFDECHNITNNMLKYIITRSNAYYRIAMSGTPLLNDEVDNYALRASFGELAVEISNTELINLGVSSVPECHYYRIVDETGDLALVDYPLAYKMGIVNHEVRNNTVQKLSDGFTAQGLIVLIMIQEIEHGHYLNLLLPDATFIHGQLTAQQRTNILNSFKVGKIKTLITSTILDEGVNLASIDVIILAGGGKTPKRVLQRVGRGLRKNTSNALTVIDFIDLGNPHLLAHSRHRLKTLRSENFAIVYKDPI